MSPALKFDQKIPSLAFIEVPIGNLVPCDVTFAKQSCTAQTNNSCST
jgi:hypothetical protein